MSEKGLEIGFPTQGWKQFLTWRTDMLGAFDSAKAKAKAHEVETYHGRVAEAEFRKWLAEFLPKRYGVTPGYIISQGIRSDQKVPHFDVVIYDALNAPVLWIEEDSDTSAAGRSMAIPAEHVLAVLEVKASFNSTSVKKAVQHLGDLSPLLKGEDAPGERYKLYLPPQFFCGLIFFELRKEHEYSETAITSVLEGLELRGFQGALVLRGEGHSKPATGELTICSSETPIESTIARSKRSLLQSGVMCDSIRVTDNLHLVAMLVWTESGFSRFAFDLLAILQGTYEAGRLSSFHGMGSSEQDP